jgi:hypothetical protein
MWNDGLGLAREWGLLRMATSVNQARTRRSAVGGRIRTLELGLVWLPGVVAVFGVFGVIGVIVVIVVNAVCNWLRCSDA